MKLSSKYKTGEIAKALVMEWFRDWGSDANATSEAISTTSDRLIKHLADNKFVIAPQPYAKPARRGKMKEDNPWLGKSHTQRLIG